MKELSVNVNNSDKEGNSPLHIVMEQYGKDREKAYEVMKVLIKEGNANLNVQNDEGWGVLHTGIKLT